MTKVVAYEFKFAHDEAEGNRHPDRSPPLGTELLAFVRVVMEGPGYYKQWERGRGTYTSSILHGVCGETHSPTGGSAGSRFERAFLGTGAVKWTPNDVN